LALKCRWSVLTDSVNLTVFTKGVARRSG